MNFRIHERTPHLDIPQVVRHRRALPSWPGVRVRVLNPGRGCPGRRQLDVRRVPGSPQVETLPGEPPGAATPVRIWLDGWESWRSARAECWCWDGMCKAGEGQCEADGGTSGSRFLYLTDRAWRCAPCAGVVTAREAARRVVGKERLRKWRRALRNGHLEAVELAAGGGGPEALAAMVALELESEGGIDVLPAGPAPVERQRKWKRRETAEEALYRYVCGLRNGRRPVELVGLLRRAGYTDPSDGGSLAWVRGTLRRWVSEGRVYEQGLYEETRYWSRESRQGSSRTLERARRQFEASELERTVERVP